MNSTDILVLQHTPNQREIELMLPERRGARALFGLAGILFSSFSPGQFTNSGPKISTFIEKKRNYTLKRQLVSQSAKSMFARNKQKQKGSCFECIFEGGLLAASANSGFKIRRNTIGIHFPTFALRRYNISVHRAW